MLTAHASTTANRRLEPGGRLVAGSRLKHLNRAGPPSRRQTDHNRAELWAMIEAIRAFPDDGRQLMIWTDSMYGVRAIKHGFPIGRGTALERSHGQSVKNSDLITLLEHELRQMLHSTRVHSHSRARQLLRQRESRSNGQARYHPPGGLKGNITATAQSHCRPR